MPDTALARLSTWTHTTRASATATHGAIAAARQRVAMAWSEFTAASNQYELAEAAHTHTVDAAIAEMEAHYG